MVETYRLCYEHERAANSAMLAMIESVPVSNRDDPRFERALTLAAHLAACRENWLAMMTGQRPYVPWFEENVPLESLRARFEAIEDRWTSYLASQTDATLAEDFVFQESDGSRYRWWVEGQVMQLLGHAFYHRGQIALLVDALGGETVDTDFVEWVLPRDPRWGAVDAP